MYFSYDFDNGITFHDTADAARAKAEEYLQDCADNADEGWDDNVTDICWGEVGGRVVETMRRPTVPEDNTDCDEWVDYAMRDALPARARDGAPESGNAGTGRRPA